MRRLARSNACPPSAARPTPVKPTDDGVDEIYTPSIQRDDPRKNTGLEEDEDDWTTQ